MTTKNKRRRQGVAQGLQNFLILAVFVVLTAVGFQIFAADATGSVETMFKLGKQVTKVMAGLSIALGVYFVAKSLT